MRNRSPAPWAEPEAIERPLEAAVLEAEMLAGLEAAAGLPGRLMAGAAWAAIGLLAAVYLRSRGHEFQFFAMWGVLLGPLFLPMAFDLIRSREQGSPLFIRSGGSASGDLDVLVVVLGTAELTADVRPLLAGLGPRLGRVTLAGLIPYQAARRPGWQDEKQEVRHRLEQAALFLQDHEPSLVLLPGSVCRAVSTFAFSVNLLVVVGRVRRQPAKVLSRICRVPVVWIGPQARV
jgi:hypothetical protein